MCVIDHCDYRIAAVALLPISSDMLKYGSGDGGLTVHADIPELNEAMTAACTPLAICGHKAKDKTIHGPGDFEAHRGTDGRNYVYDFARLLPPESPSEDPETRTSGACSTS
ncbi:histidine kinase A family protein [Acanthamoeba castellanii str. Neff]|uniref:Histidine kinase A family protein n=1 Tax=Acanthamoeba castellanii (strain ATCC 30010 / Neff) TaxID=1257118 RepID=L8H6Y2_ACACF|nr:histidine kinase A family protein [Acanthamoeba castellanii str. Neff]ELR21279.1 histidine kinase A family protein [Acanthamoeba castellanii str. Neff]